MEVFLQWAQLAVIGQALLGIWWASWAFGW
jgi:hypothetical protein